MALTNVYFADVGQQRNGLAIVTHEAADDAVLLPVLNLPSARPILGVRFGVIWYFTAHAPRGGNGVDDILDTVNQFMANRPSNGRPGWQPRGQIASGALKAGDTLYFHNVDCDERADYLTADPSTGAVQA